ncbi:hypothetical protein GCM10010405_51440 [Streptomyces macrosporus]|uniref:Transposase n=1 Tax=Streptomyces macrosporus TaxID=44032 RepID=A0ABP5XT80_9ACTN
MDRLGRTVVAERAAAAGTGAKPKPGRPRKRPDTLPGDRGHDHDTYRRVVRARGVKPVIARRGA